MDVTLIDHNRELGRCPRCGECIEVFQLKCRFCDATFDNQAAREAASSYRQAQQSISKVNNRKAWIYGAASLCAALVGYALYWGLRIYLRSVLR